MMLLEQSRRDCASVDRAEAAERVRTTLLRKWGVGKPGGFTNRYDDPRAGGCVELPGGFFNRLYVAVAGHLSMSTNAQWSEFSKPSGQLRT